MIDAVEIREGWYWPKSDVRCWQYMKDHSDLPEIATSFTGKKQRKTIVQAGGNAGYYPKKYSQFFETVYTFEPDWLNFYCLNLNNPYQNVIKNQACLGNNHQLVSLNITEKNRGKNFISGNGEIPTYTIDNLKLNSCNLIQLDIEGFEYYAILGAVETINSYKPVIVLEIWEQLKNRFENDINQKVYDLLDNLGYRHEADIHEGDKVFVYKK